MCGQGTRRQRGPGPGASADATAPHTGSDRIRGSGATMIDWEPLPARKSKRRQRHGARTSAEDGNGEDATMAPVDSGAASRKRQREPSGSIDANANANVNANGGGEEGVRSNKDAVEEAILQRTQMKKAVHRDGVNVGDGSDGLCYEYLDHTADVQLHTWGSNLQEAMETMAVCMFNYMTDIGSVTVDPTKTRTVEAEGHDLQSLLFNYMDVTCCKYPSLN